MGEAVRIAILCVALAAPVAAQEGVPFVPEQWKYGVRSDESRLRLCVDTRDDGWEVARDIGEAIAGALLLEPVIFEVRDGPVAEELDEVYKVMLRNCAVHMDFKLLPGAYPQWLMPTRPYYLARYVFVTTDPGWRSLGDAPAGTPIASTLGTRADYRLSSYLLAQSSASRWRRFPVGTSAQTLALVLDGTAPLGLVWEPSLWAAGQADPAYEALRVIGSAPLPESDEGVGAVVLARETFLRASIDEAITALSADGTLAAILEDHGFPGRVVP